MLGDSMRRRQGSGKPQRPKRPKSDSKGFGGSWWPLDWGWGRWALTVVVLTGVCFGVGYLLALFVLFPVPAEAAAGVPTPDVVGHTLEDARGALVKAGLAVGTLDTLNGSEAPGTVLAQAPLPGQQLRGGATVTLSISAGLARVHVPPLRGMNRTDAVALLDSLGLHAMSTRNLSPLPVGQVVQSAPEAGAAVARGDTVRLTVSEGPPLVPAPMPGLDTTPQLQGFDAASPGGEGRGS